MMRIIALNENSDGEESNDDEITVTKEAEETIAASEYMRALEFKSKGELEPALILMTELLETRVLNEIEADDKNNKLLCIRYSCHKNIALIYEEQSKYDLALEHFMQAIELDDTEVYIMHRLGQLALKKREHSLAHYAFQKCLDRNPNHWPSADGILQVLCQTENIMGAYGWALKWYLIDESYERGINVLTEITEKFPHMIKFFQKVWKHEFKIPAGRTSKGKQSVFPESSPDIPVEDTQIPKPDLENFRIDHLSWLSIGKYIISVYNHLEETKQTLLFVLTIEEMLLNKTVNTEEPDKIDLESNATDESNGSAIPAEPTDDNNQNTDSSQSPKSVTQLLLGQSNENSDSKPSQQCADLTAEDSGENPKQETEATKPKVRRRCSDLSFLEQWGWHKNRRYSSRKKSQQDRPETDTSLNGFLRRIFPKYFETTYDNDSPFVLETKSEKNSIKKEEDSKEKHRLNQVNYEEFQNFTEDDFQDFLKELRSQNFDLILIIFLWLKYVSKYWDQSITAEMKDVYHTLFTYYLNHYDLVTWNQLSNDDFNASYRMTLFFLELDYEQESLKADGHGKDINARWKMLFHHLMFNSGCAFVISDDIYEKNMIRLIHLEHLWAKFENQLHRSVECLLHLESLIDKQNEDFQLLLPNLKDVSYIDLETVRTTRIDLQRKISLNNVKTLYENEKFSELIDILKESLIYSTEIKNSDNSAMKVQTQFEVLLESFWNVEKYEECLIWSERCLKHAVDNLLTAHTDTYRYQEWAECINYILIYIEELIIKDANQIMTCLKTNVSRLVQSVTRILTHQLDTTFDKNNNPTHPINTKRPWVVLHQVLQETEDKSPKTFKPKSLDTTNETDDIEDLLPHTILMLFTAHEFLGRRQWCTRDNGQLLLYTLDAITGQMRAPSMEPCRELINEYLEQITYCLYGYPPKKARSKHIEEHEASGVDLTWKRAIQLFDIYRPENLPEFNSYKLESISADMEQLLLKIVPLIPKDMDPSSMTTKIFEFINGDVLELPEDCNMLPHRIACIYYLLADYYFKNRDFSKTIKYYALDLTISPERFDSWAGMALSKASKVETKLNSFTSFDLNDFLKECETTIRCFEQCIKLKKEQTLLWVEYGSFAYTIHSYCSRDLKHSSDRLNMEEFAFFETRKEKYLSVAYNCFSIADKSLKNDLHDEEEGAEAHDEKWLNQYMLGKIAEKRKEHPKVYMEHYLTAGNFLYENNATYPIKLNHSNPTTLSIEALEIFYRTNSSIIKYLETHKEVTREIGNYFVHVLKNLAGSPFAYNQAKIDDSSLNALKRKIAEKAENANAVKRQKSTEDQLTEQQSQVEKSVEAGTTPAVACENENKQKEENNKVEKSRSSTPMNAPENKETSPSRRGSQESTATTTTTSATGTTSSASSSTNSDSSSSDSSSSDSESGSSSDDEGDKPDENTPYSATELETIYKSCVKNFEECITRFPEHYKSMYRLAYHYLHAPDNLKDLSKCRQLLLGSYNTTLGTQINGLFADRKNNNFFNGIWRIPTTEIDRPGSFSSHMVKCVSILIQVLHKSEDYKLLIDIALQLHRNPDSDKRYIKDAERMELYQQAVSFCIQIMRDILKRNTEKRNDDLLLQLLIDIYKAHKKCQKHINQKEATFTQILVDVYKVYIQDKGLKIPDNINYLDLAARLCVQEISGRKNQEKQAAMFATGISGIGQSVPGEITPVSKTPVSIPGLSAMTTKPSPLPSTSARPRGRPVGSKNTPSAAGMGNLSSNYMQNLSSSFGLNMLDPTSMAALSSIYSNPTLNAQMAKNPVAFQNLVSEYYKLLGGPSLTGMSPLIPNLAAPSMSPILNPLQSNLLSKSKAPASSITSATSNPTPKIPQFDIKNLIASATSQVAKSSPMSAGQSTTINVGSGELTITPTSSKPTPDVSSSASSSKLPTNSISVTKVSSPVISVKPLSDLSIKPTGPPKMPSLPELPKSLTITPATSYSTEKPKSKSSTVPQVSLHPEVPKSAAEKFVGKMKTSGKSKAQTPYSRQDSASAGGISHLSAAQLNSLSALSQQYPFMSGFSMDNYNQQANLLSSYAELLKGTGAATNPALLAQMSQLSHFPQFQMLNQKRPYTKRNRQSKNQGGFPIPPASSMPTAASSKSAASSSSLQMKSKQSFGPTFPMPSVPSKSPLSALSPNPSPGISLPPTLSISPSPTLQISPTKTLQQKLAEKQKANQMNEKSSSGGNASGSSSSSGKRKNSVDVIILD